MPTGKNYIYSFTEIFEISLQLCVWNRHKALFEKPLSHMHSSIYPFTHQEILGVRHAYGRQSVIHGSLYSAYADHCADVSNAASEAVPLYSHMRLIHS